MADNKTPAETGASEAKLAAEAARRGDAEGMVRGVFAGGLADWLFFRAAKQYASLPPQDVQDCVAAAIGDAYKALASGTRISALPGYLLKATSTKAVDMLRQRRSECSSDMDAIANVRDPAIEAVRQESHERLRKEALYKARELLPLLGMENIRKVMATIFDAVEAGMDDLLDSEIAAAVDLSEETVRRLKSRGFERLRRLANERGYDLARYERAIGIAEAVLLDEEGYGNE